MIYDGAPFLFLSLRITCDPMVSLRSPSVVPTKTYGLRGRIDVNPAFLVDQIGHSGADMAGKK